MSKEVKVKKHKRRKPTGGQTTVKRHTRIVGGGLSYQVLTRSSLTATQKKNYNDCIKRQMNEGAAEGLAEQHCGEDLISEEKAKRKGVIPRKREKDCQTKWEHLEFLQAEAEKQRSLGNIEKAKILEQKVKDYRNIPVGYYCPPGKSKAMMTRLRSYYARGKPKELKRRKELERMSKARLDYIFKDYFDGETPPDDKERVISDLLDAEAEYGDFHD